MVAAMLNQLTLSGLPAFQRVLELTQPVDDSRELWLKLGHHKFIVGNYSPDGHFPIWETKLVDPKDSKRRLRRKGTKNNAKLSSFVNKTPK